MKKTLLTLVINILFSYSYAQTTAIPDANFEQALIDLGYDTAPINGTVPTAQIDFIGALDISNRNITDLTGIEDFASLTSLECSTNQLTYVNVSKNTILLSLNVANNELNYLNVKNGNNTNFINFKVFDNNNLTCIEVDNEAYSTANWGGGIDAQMSFSENCGTYVPDDNFEQALIDLGYDAGPLDNFVPTPNVNTITSLQIFSKNIADLTGIEDFVSLTTLNCRFNELTNLDVSKNTALTNINAGFNQLTSLDISQNLLLTSLTIHSNQLASLDLSKNKALISLATTNNNLTSIDLSNNTALESLSIEVTLITSLDLSSNTNLTSLYCGENDLLTSLNVKNGNNTNITTFSVKDVPNLTCIEVDDPSYSITNWTQIDAQTIFTQDCSAGPFTYVPDDRFEQALIDLGHDAGPLDDYVPTANINSVTFLNISSKSIADLTGIEDFIALTYLNCYSNNLTSIDISNNTLLTYFNVGTNQLTDLDVTQNTALTSLIVSMNDLQTINLSNNTSLTSFNASNNNFASLDFSLNTLISTIYVSNNKLTSLDVSSNAFLDTFRANGNELSSLNVKNGNNFNFVQFFADNNPNLTCIQVDDASYSTTNWTNIDAQTTFSEDCSAVPLTYVPDDNFEQALIDLGYDAGPLDDYVPTANINTITTLSVLSKNISDLTGIEDFVALDRLSCSNNQLTTLDLSQNTLLTILEFYGNQLTTLDLSQNPLITYIDGESNQLTSINLTQNTALTELDLYENLLPTIDLSQNTSLTYLQLDNNKLTTIDLSENILLTNLIIDENELTSVDLSQNTVLRRVTVENNQLISFSVKNGNNSNFTSFYARGNPNLTCIEVDNETYSTTNWTNIDPQASFSEDCSVILLTYVPDDNFEQALIDLGYDAGPLDDYVPTNNINALTSLDVSSRNISDLTGIEDFVALEELECYQNNLSSLVITNLSALEKLNCSENSITSIDVSNNVLLSQLLVTLNDLSSLNVSINTALTYLDFSSNNISTIDLSNTPLLKSLFCLNNNLTGLDLSNNPVLASVWCLGNSITELDVSNQPSLVRLRAENNELTSLNVKNGNNTNFTQFIATGNPNLVCIEVDDASYSTTNWTSIDAQTNFSEDCDAVPLTYVPDDNFEQALIDLGYDVGPLDDYVPTANINTITILPVNNKIISDLTGIEDFVALEFLNCSQNNLTTINLSQNTALRILQIHQNRLTTIDLSQHLALTDLIITHNRLTNINLSQNTALTDLFINDNDLTSIDLNQNTALEALSIKRNDLTSLDLSNQPVLSFLSLDGNDFTALEPKFNTSLTTLFCEDNTLLTSLTVKNGNNTNINDFYVTGSPNLTCIEVDNANYSTSNWTDIDSQIRFSENCSDTEAPIISLTGANPQTIQLGEGYTELGATTNDGTAVVIDATEFVDAVGTYTIYYNATDGNGNAATQVTRTVNVIDTAAPIITLTGSNPQTIQLGEGYTELGATTNDGTTVVIDATEFVDAVGTYTIYYNATDSNGNAATQVTRAVNVIDTAAPIITLTGSNPQTIQLGDGYTELGATTNDGTAVVIDATEFVDAVGTYTIYYNATDGNGNAATQVTRTVNVIDTAAPIISLTGANPQTIQLGDGYTELGATTNDGTAVVIDATEFVDAVGTYTIYYNATDGNGNAATQVTRTVHVVDTAAPIISLTGANPQTIQLGDGYTELGATTNDGTAVVIDATEFVDAVGTYTIYYNATDGNGNAATQVTRTVHVVDTAAPIISLTGANPQTIQLGDGYTELGATTNDGTAVVIDATEFVDAVGTYTIYYNATDGNGNAATQVTRTVHVVDTAAPIISLTGANPQTIQLGDGYTELGATTNDGTAVVIDATEFVDAVGTYTIYYNATDGNGNAATQVTRTVHVVDTAAPIISLTGANPQTIQLGDGYTELGATTNDGTAVVIDATEFVDAVGTYTIYYNATDGNGNAATQVTRTVHVVDTAAPIISLTGANPQTIQLGDGYTELGATTNDGTAVVIDATEFVDAVGTYTIYYNATDGNGNAATQVTRTVHVVDTAAPIISLTGANPQTIQLGDGYTELGATTNDGTAVVIDATEFVDAVGTYTIYYNATDGNGNAATQVTRTVHVVDTAAPIISLTGVNPQTIQLGDGYTELGATTNDGTAVVIDATEFVDAVGTYTIYYNATDGNGNAATQVTRTVHVVDTAAPIISLTGANPQTIQLGDGYTELGATTNDGTAVVIDATEFVDAVGTYTIYYNATDGNGNAATQVTRTVNVIDTAAPIISLTGANPQTIQLGDGYTELGATTNDGTAVVIDATEFVDAVGTYTIYYNATDGNGNAATQVTRTVHVVDTAAPIISLTGANPQTIQLGEGYTELGATTDDGTVVDIDASDFVDEVGTYTIYYNATDSSGNEAIELTRTVIVEGIAVIIPKAFSPNGDQRNDTWVIENIEKYPNSEILIFNRWGAKVFEVKNYQNNWNGVSKSQGKTKLAIGSYLYIIRLNDGKNKPIQGWVYINY